MFWCPLERDTQALETLAENEREINKIITQEVAVVC